MPSKEDILRQQHEDEARQKTEQPPVENDPAPTSPVTPHDKTESQKADEAEQAVRRRKAEIQVEVINRGFNTLQDWEAKLKSDQEVLKSKYEELGKAQAELQKRIDNCNKMRQEAVTSREQTAKWKAECDKTMAEALKIKDSLESGTLEIAEQKKELQDKQIVFDVECQPAIDMILSVAATMTKQAGVYQDKGLQSFADYLCNQAAKIEALMSAKKTPTEVEETAGDEHFEIDKSELPEKPPAG